MATITPQVATLAGLAPTQNSASAGGDGVKNSRGTVKVRIKNGSGASITATAAPSAVSRAGDGQFPTLTVPNISVAVPAGQERIIGPIPTAYNDISGLVQFTYSATSSVTVEAWDE